LSDCPTDLLRAGREYITEHLIDDLAHLPAVAPERESELPGGRSVDVASIAQAEGFAATWGQEKACNRKPLLPYDEGHSAPLFHSHPHTAKE